MNAIWSLPSKLLKITLSLSFYMQLISIVSLNHHSATGIIAEDHDAISPNSRKLTDLEEFTIIQYILQLDS